MIRHHWPGTIPVSVLIPVRNEEENIESCLASVQWANDIVVIDSNSQDRTCQLAIEAGARVVQFRYQAGGPKKKNWALENVAFRNQWVLILDADERITPELALEILDAVHNAGEHVGYYINRRFYFMNRFIRHAGYYPSWNLRLLKAGCGAYERFTDEDTKSGDNEVHEHIVLQGKAGRLRSPMDHFAYLTIDQFLEKHVRYSNWEARTRQQLSAPADLGSEHSRIALVLKSRRILKRWGRKFPFPHWLRFFYHYFWKLGLLDGREGYIFCHLLAEYEFWICAKQLELKTQPKTESVFAATVAR
jgi:glycosyltransferase involved in cell wall biosynthesis